MEASPADLCPRCGTVATEGAACALCLLSSALTEESSDDSSHWLDEEILPPTLAPRSFGHYELIEEIARGGMGVVYRARDTMLDCPVALKVIDARLSVRAESRARFLREARAAAQLRHPNIASVLYYGEEKGRCFYAMEFVEGETLEAHVCRAGPLPPGRALDVVRQVARALAAADARGVVHRDLKPANLMFGETESGHPAAAPVRTVKVIDFGLAKAVSDESAINLTRGGFVGTPAFASPEQFVPPVEDGDAAGAVDTRADIYSLGVTFWYLLTGKVPFVGRNLAEIRDRQLNRPLPLGHLVAARVPAPIQACLRGMLAADPAERPQTARELEGQLRRCQELLAPAFLRPIARWAWPLAAASALAVGAAWFFRAAPPSSVSPPTSVTKSAFPPLDDERSVAVLPFASLSADQDDGAFADGVQNDIIAALAKVQSLKVIGRASVMGYRGETTPDRRRDIGQALGVKSLLEGTVRRVGDRVLITVRLLDPSDGRQLWAQTFDRSRRDALTVQGEVAEEVSAALRATLSPEEKSRVERAPTNNPDALALYLRGDAFYRTRMTEDAEKAKVLFEQAIKLDPNFALAWARLAMAHHTIQVDTRDHAKRAQFLATALPLAQEALRLQPDLAEGHRAIAACHAVVGDYQRGLAAIQTALRLAPHDADVLTGLAYMYVCLNRHAEARVVYERAAELNPQYVFLWVRLARTCELLRDWTAAARARDRAVTLDPTNTVWKISRAYLDLKAKGNLEPLRRVLGGFPPTAQNTDYYELYWRGSLAFCERDYSTGEQVWERILRVLPPANRRVPAVILCLGTVRHLRNGPGDAEKARENFERALAGFRTQMEADPLNGFIHAQAGETLAFLGCEDEARNEAERALALDRGEEDGDGKSTSRQVAAIYACLRDADRALALVEELLAGPSALAPQELRFEVEWDPIRDDPRFQRLIRR